MYLVWCLWLIIGAILVLRVFLSIKQIIEEIVLFYLQQYCLLELLKSDSHLLTKIVLFASMKAL